MATENLRYNITLNDQVSAGLAKIEARLASLEAGFNKTNKATTSMNGFMKGSFMLGAAGAIAGIATQAWDMASAYVTAAGSLQANTNALKVASGSTDQFRRNQQFLSNLTDRLPISITAASEGLKMWTAATKTSSIAGNTARTMFEDVSIATASMGIDAETSKGIFLALSQMMSKGTVSAEELRGQLGERLPGAFSLMAQSMGVTEQRLGKMMEQGLVISEDVLPNFTKVLREEFGTGLAESANSINAVTTRLENMRTRGIIAMTPAITAMMVQFERSILGVGSALTVVWERSEPLKDAFASLTNVFGQTGQAIWDAFTALFSVFNSLEGSGIPLMKIFGTLIMNLLVPLHLFSASLQLTYRVLETVYLLFEKLFQGDFAGMGDVLTSQAGKIEDVFKNTFDNIKQGYTDIWTDGPKDISATEGDLMTRSDTNKGGGNKMKSLLSGSLFDQKAAAGTGKKSKELEKASTNISGSAPRNTTITINSLIGQNNNYISNVQDPYKDLSTFMEKLKQALAQEIVDVNIQIG